MDATPPQPYILFKKYSDPDNHVIIFTRDGSFGLVNTNSYARGR